MPENDHAAQLIAQLEASVVLPDDWTDFFEKSGQVGTSWPDLRQFPRFYLRTMAALTIHATFPARPAPDAPQRVFVKDISRSALAFLHGEQLFPGERLQLLLNDGVQRETVVVRCRKIQPKCYEVAAKFATQL